jgi:hypothetical protein
MSHHGHLVPPPFLFLLVLLLYGSGFSQQPITTSRTQVTSADAPSPAAAAAVCPQCGHELNTRPVPAFLPLVMGPELGLRSPVPAHPPLLLLLLLQSAINTRPELHIGPVPALLPVVMGPEPAMDGADPCHLDHTACGSESNSQSSDCKGKESSSAPPVVNLTVRKC